MNRRIMHFTIGIALACLIATPAMALNPILKELEDTFVRLGEQMRPSVVYIEVTGTREARGQSIPDDLRNFFGIPPQGPGQSPSQPAPPMPTQASGSGFIVDNEGHILTNNHVISDAKSIEVTMNDGKKFPAQVIGTDEQTDIAVIKIESDDPLPVAPLGDSSIIKPGQFAIAIGSPQGLEGSMSFGHVTALGREGLRLPNLRFQGFIQTDAAINLGNSGGPLCNIDGEVIGINVAIVYGANSIGFAIPIDTAKGVIEQLITTGRVSRGFLGVQIEDAAEFAEAMNLPDQYGAFIQDVRPNTPAEAAGVRMYDIIRSVDGKRVRTASELMRLIAGYAPGETVTIELWRDGAAIEKRVTLMEFALEAPVAEVTETNPLGIQVQPIPEELRTNLELDDNDGGVIISQIDPFGPAYAQGLRQGDVILELARENVTSVEQFSELMSEHATPGSKFVVRVLRRGGIASIVAISVPEKSPEE